MKKLLQTLHIDPWLLLGLLVLMSVGLVTIYSAGGQDIGLIQRQVTRLGIAMAAMMFLAQIPPAFLRRISIYGYIVGLAMLVAVLFFGDMGKGAQRWLDLKFVRFQPSEIMKLAVPMMVAWYISKFDLPPKTRHIIIGFLMVVVPTILIAKQPDLGTSLLIASSGIFALFLAGMRWRLIGFVSVLAGAFLPIMWFFLMQDYQKQRVLTFLNPESDPLGSGYHIIQSKIAIGSGGQRLVARHSISVRVFAGTAHRFYIRSIQRRVRFIWCTGAVGDLFVHYWTGSHYCCTRAGCVLKAIGGQYYAYVFRLCFCEHGHGFRHATRCRRTTSTCELW
jgi:cell division protein FtsW (lipid II flippase)